MLSDYLRELERELSHRLPREDVQARLAEAESHLRDGIEGRIELGMEPLAAEREAIEAFGLSRRVARATPAAGVRARVGLLGAGYGLGVLFILFGYHFQVHYPRSTDLLFLTWIGLGVAFAVVAFRARRPMPGRVLATGLLGSLIVWLTLGATWLDLSPYMGGSVVPPGRAASQIQECRTALVEKTDDLAALDAGLETVRGLRGVEGLRGPGGYRVSVAQYWVYESRVRFTTVNDPKAAAQAWKDAVGPTARLRMEVERLKRMLVAIPQAQAASTLSNLVVVAPSVLPANVGVALGAVLIDVSFGGLGLLVSNLRRRRPRGGLRA